MPIFVFLIFYISSFLLKIFINSQIVRKKIIVGRKTCCHFFLDHIDYKTLSDFYKKSFINFVYLKKQNKTWRHKRNAKNCKYEVSRNKTKEEIRKCKKNVSSKNIVKKKKNNKDLNKNGEKEKRKKKDLFNKIISSAILNGDKENKGSSKKTEEEKDKFDFLNYFKLKKDGSLVSEINKEDNEKIMKSTYLKDLMDELNLKEEDIINNIKNCDNRASELLNTNYNNIEKKLKEEETKEDENFFNAFMNESNNMEEDEECINFRTIERKFKNVLKEAVQIFMLKKEHDFKEIIYNEEKFENAYNSKEILNTFATLLKSEYLFSDLTNDILIQITKKSMLLSYLNYKFSNDIENSEWHKSLENYIYTSIRNKKFKIKKIIYSIKSISIILQNKTGIRAELESESDDAYENIENIVKYSIEEYEKATNVNFLNTFHMFITLE